MLRVTVQNSSADDIRVYAAELSGKSFTFFADTTTLYDLSRREYDALESVLTRLNARNDVSVSVSTPVTGGITRVGQDVHVESLTLDLSASPETTRVLGSLFCAGNAVFTAGHVLVSDGYVGGSVIADGGAILSLNGLTIENDVTVSGVSTSVELANCTVKGGLTVGPEASVTRLFSNILGSVEVDPEGSLTVLPEVVDPPFIVGTQQEFADALSVASNGDIIQILGEITFTTANINNPLIVIDKEISLVGTGTLQTTNDLSAPITFISVTANNVTFGQGLNIKHRRSGVSIGEIDTAVSVNAQNFVSRANLSFMKFGYVLRGTFDISGTTTYTGPLGNTHRHFGIYSMTGNSTIHDLTFSFPFEANPRDIFILSNQEQAGSSFNGKLTVRNVTQANVSTSVSDPAQYYYSRQFFVQESFAAEANRANQALRFENCSWDDFSGGIFVYNTTASPLNAYQSIEIINCTQGIGTLIDSYTRAPVGDQTDPKRHKGMFFLDSMINGFPSGSPSVFTLSGNTVPLNGANRRTEFSYFTVPGQQASIAAYNNLAYFPPI